MSIELVVVSLMRALVEVAMLSLLGQGAVGLLSGARREQNPIYRLFVIITGPVVRIFRGILPRVIADRHVPFVVFFILFWLWIVLAVLKQHLSGMGV